MMPVKQITCDLCGEPKSKTSVHICDNAAMKEWRNYVETSLEKGLARYLRSRQYQRDRFYVDPRV
jgi:hypothetical protein